MPRIWRCSPPSAGRRDPCRRHGLSEGTSCALPPLPTASTGRARGQGGGGQTGVRAPALRRCASSGCSAPRCRASTSSTRTRCSRCLPSLRARELPEARGACDVALLPAAARCGSRSSASRPSCATSVPPGDASRKPEHATTMPAERARWQVRRPQGRRSDAEAAQTTDPGLRERVRGLSRRRSARSRPTSTRPCARSSPTCARAAIAALVELSRKFDQRRSRQRRHARHARPRSTRRVAACDDGDARRARARARPHRRPPPAPAARRRALHATRSASSSASAGRRSSPPASMCRAGSRPIRARC